MKTYTQKGAISIPLAIAIVLSLGIVGYIILEDKGTFQSQEEVQNSPTIPGTSGENTPVNNQENNPPTTETDNTTQTNGQEETSPPTTNTKTETTPPQTETELTEMPVNVPSDWQHVDVPNRFSLSIPSGWTYNELQGIDSYVAEIEGDGTRLGLDHGWYSNSLAEDNDPNHEVTYELIDGYTAKVVVPRTADGEVTGVYFPDLGGDVQKIRFQMSGYDLSAAQQNIALTIFRTLDFKE